MKQIAWFFKTYFIFTLLFVVQKPLFMLLTPTPAGQNIDNLFSSAFEVMWHGLPLDLSLAGYFTIIPAHRFFLDAQGDHPTCIEHLFSDSSSLDELLLRAQYHPVSLLVIPIGYHTFLLLLHIAIRRLGECQRVDRLPGHPCHGGMYAHHLVCPEDV